LEESRRGGKRQAAPFGKADGPKPAQFFQTNARGAVHPPRRVLARCATKCSPRVGNRAVIDWAAMPAIATVAPSRFRRLIRR
jgi:hypothetical protein